MMEELPILWRDEHLIAVHKPSGWLVHRTGLDAAETRFVVQTLRGQLRGRHVHPVHRLDKGTCGVLLLALTAEAARGMGAAFTGHTVHKRYLALVRGWPADHFEVDHALRPDDAPPETEPQPAQTRFRCMARWARDEAYDPAFPSTRCALVEASPLTGRRHQIRRHLKHVAHPILGDATHGKGPLNRWWAERLGRQRLWLHAQSLCFVHPITGEAMEIHSGLQVHAGGLTAPPDGHADLQHWQALTSGLDALIPSPHRRT